ncbi:glycosyltransferase [Patescibacteria group bacterium]|nr:glycosyltransferase [Patescibacteria group bacterium]
MKLDTKFKLAQQYNRPDTVVIVASYPGKTDRSIKDIDAVASYTDHFTASFRRELAKSGRRIIVLAQKMDRKEEWYQEKGMLICRVWDKGDLIYIAQILRALLFFPRVRSILVEFEFHQFGGNLTTMLFPLLLAGFKLLHRVPTLVMHQVVKDIVSLSGHVNITPGSFLATIFNEALSLFYRICAILSDSVVVHNEILKQRLTRLTAVQATVIPHGLGAIQQSFSKDKARKILGIKRSEKIILSFGFLTWYKGADWLIHEWTKTKLPQNWRLIWAGGESPNIRNRNHYQRFVSALYNAVEKRKDTSITGFLEDKDIPLYFAAADLVVLPYRTLMSSSGPLAMTIAFKKPFLLSKALTPYLSDNDFTASLKALKLTKEDISFARTGEDFLLKTKRALKKPKILSSLSKRLCLSRQWPVVATEFDRHVRQTALASNSRSAIMHREPISYANAYH